MHQHVYQASLTPVETGSAHEMLTYTRRAKHVTYAGLCGTGPQSCVNQKENPDTVLMRLRQGTETHEDGNGN